MKKIKKTIATLFASAILGASLIGLVQGCATPVKTAVITPATATTPAATNYVVTAYTPNTTALQVGTVLQQAAPALPAPFSTAASVGGWLLAAIGIGVAGYTNAKRITHLNTLQALVTGVETALPGIAALPGMTPQNATAALTAVKDNITATTSSNDTQSNLKSVLNGVGLG